MQCAEIREAFLKFFESKQHEVVTSSSLIPGNDATLLFTNAGMVQFKDVFLGEDKRPYSRATSSQRCVRAGGKHNDLENVGYTARHHTFFEMLGNFSFGDYFKREAIQFAWEFLTKTLGLPEEKLWVTVHVSDDEAADIWLKEVGVSAERFSRLDEDNFWQMGDTGPCGPSSEIFYDHGEDVPGGPPGSENDDLDRYIEIWNLVFMQFERQANGELVPLPKPSVDTGMGLERIAAVMQNVHTNYEIDLFQALLQAAGQVTGSKDLDNKSLRVIADHIRSCSFLIADGVLPSNEGRGYVLRRIIRRAIRHGNQLGQSDVFFYKLVPALVEQMGQAYPELTEKQSQIESALLAEEKQFAKTLEKGMSLLDSAINKLTSKIIPGEVVFTLYDTYGFPVDLTADIARERNLELDLDGYEAHMDAQRKRARASGAFKVDYTDVLRLDAETDFVGYQSIQSEGTVTAILQNGEMIESVSASADPVSNLAVVLDKTPFYGESGGQVGDSGYLTKGETKFEVSDCQKSSGNHLHLGTLLSGSITVGDSLDCAIDQSVRTNIKLNHSATHLLHAALRKVLGDHVTQKGSLVEADKLRFDFSHNQAVSPKEIGDIERLVNQKIRDNSEVSTELCNMDEAKQKGAMMLFGEKYGDEVRVLSMGDGFSVELCGGTHVSRTGDIGLFKIVSESGISSGVRRIEAVTGEGAINQIALNEAIVESIGSSLKAQPSVILDKFEALLAQQKQLEKELSAAKSKLASASANDWIAEAEVFGDVKVLIKSVEGVEAKSLRDMVDQLKNKLGTAAVLIAAVNEGKVSLAAGVTKDAVGKVKAGDLVQSVAKGIGGKGGGRPDMAQGGGTDVDALPEALSNLRSYLAGSLSA